MGIVTNVTELQAQLSRPGIAHAMKTCGRRIPGSCAGKNIPEGNAVVGCGEVSDVFRHKENADSSHAVLTVNESEQLSCFRMRFNGGLTF